jgi:hypothetical protein
MATAVTFEPKIIDFRAVPPGSVSEWSESVIAIAPSDASVTAALMGDQVHFRLDGIRTYDRVERGFTAEEIAELPPWQRQRAQDLTIVEDILASESNGQTPLAVQKKQKIIVSVRYSAHNLTPDQDVYTATLVITGNTWEPVSIPVTMLVGQVETTFSSGVKVRQGLKAPLPFVVRSLAGPDTEVLYMRPAPPRSSYFRDWYMKPVVISVPRGQTVNGSLIIEAPSDATVFSYAGGIMQSAFQGRQIVYLDPTIDILPGLVTVTLAQSGNLVAKQGETVKCAIKISATGIGPVVVLTPAGALPQGVLAQTTELTGSEASAVVREIAFKIDGNAPLVSNVPITINWSAYAGEQTGSINVTLSILPGVGTPTRSFQAATDGFRFPNKWSFTEEDGRAMRARFASAVPDLMVIQIELLRHALNSVSLNPLPFGPSAPLPDYVVDKVIAAVAGEILGQLNDKIVGAIPGDEYGRCGGMAFAGYDFFLRGWRVIWPTLDSTAANGFGDLPSDTRNGFAMLRPPASGELRVYVWNRLLDSLDLNARSFFEWIADLHVAPVISKAATIALLGLAGSVGGPVGSAIGVLIGSQTDIFELGGPKVLRNRTRDEMNKLKQKLAREAAWPIGLVYGHSANPIDQHQVLALKYEDRGDGTARLDVWDNNDANRSRTLTLDFRGGELVVTQMRAGRTVDENKPIKGILCEEYYSIQPPLSLKRT